MALVGESGSGKTTISRAVGGLHKEWTGTLRFEGRELARSARQRRAEDRRRVQYIFQNPYLSLNPRLTIEQIIRRPMELFGIAKGKAGHRACGRADGAGGARLGDAPLPGQPALRWGAAARRDRPRAGRRARRDDLRRDHLGARRVGAGLDRRAARGAPEGARHQHAVRDPQPRAGPLHRRARGDPPGRPRGRGGLGRDGHGDPAAGVHPRAARQQPAASTDALRGESP